MLFHMNTGELAHALSSVVPIADMGSTIEQSCVYIEARDGSVYFSATDMTNSARHVKPALITDEGCCLVSARKMQSLVKTLPSSAIEVSADDKEVRVKCGKINVSIPSLDPDQFYPLVFVDVSNGFEMPFDVFAQAARSCVHNVAVKGNRPTLTCVHIWTDESSLHFTATDSFKVYETSISNASDFKIDALVPGHFLQKVASIKAGRSIKFAVDHNQIAFSDGEIEMGSSLNTGTYPNVAAVLNSYTALLNAVVDLASLKRALDRANSVRAHTVRLEAERDTLKITGISKDDGSSYEEIECQCGDSRSEKIYLSNGLLAQYISSLGSPSVTLAFCGENRPLGISGDSYRGIVMPVRAPEGW